jgi:hypothetical protein
LVAACGSEPIAPGPPVPGDASIQDAGDVPPGCATGTVSLGAKVWHREDIVFCVAAGLPPAAIRPSQGAASLCGPTWHLCAHPEIVSRNDRFDLDAADLIATIDDGDDCVVVNSRGSPHRASSDLVRGGFAGSCSGARSARAWGRMSVGPCYAPGMCGSLCCR